MQGGRYELTRRQVATRLGVSLSTVRRMEFVRLCPVCDGDGIWRFDPVEVEALPPRTKRTRKTKRQRQAAVGRTAARVFKLFERGADLTYIVTGLKLEPRVVRGLHSDWLRGLTAEQPDARQTERREHEVERESAGASPTAQPSHR